MTWELSKKFKVLDTSGLPSFDNFQKPLERALWVLWVVKDKLKISRLKADQIAYIIVHAKEVSLSAKSITNAFKRAEGKIHTYKESTGTFYEIMKAGKDHLVAEAGEDFVNIYYFEPGKRYQSKSILANNILTGLKGELKIVDPYCDIRTLDVLSRADARDVKFLTRLENLSERNQGRFQRELQDLKTECPDMEFRNYSKSEIHDRYIISRDRLIILGYSLKDLGAKESFAIILDKKTACDIFDALVGTFNRRWKVASQL